ncbi:MAG TPA: hypothetical protein VGQ20_03265 [Acidimicrobiales bacterium]|jgi:hypothetical protein|nr:hypothetical protein [Acidimicrobiales bacterium]
MAEALEVVRHRSMAGPLRTLGGLHSARGGELASAAFELGMCALTLVFVHNLSDDALPTGVAATAGALVIVRTVLGSARAAFAGGLAFGLLSLIQVLVLVPALDDTRDLRLTATLVALGVIPYVAGTVPAVALRGLDEGRRGDGDAVSAANLRACSSPVG